MGKLTVQQEAFINELLKGKSQRQAYKVAYPNSRKWQNKSIDERASKLFSNTKVRSRFNELRDKVVDRAEEEAIISTLEIIEELADIARDDIGNYLDFRTDKVIIGHEEDGSPIFDYKIIIDLKDSKEMNTKNIEHISLSREGSFKFKLYERDKALFKLVEIFGIDKLKEAKQKLLEERFQEEKRINDRKHW